MTDLDRGDAKPRKTRYWLELEGSTNGTEPAINNLSSLDWIR
jgi:hypothetical protein